MPEDLAQQVPDDQYMCSLQGKLRIRIMSPVYSDSLYGRIVEELQPNTSPVDIFMNDVDPKRQFKHFPLMSKAFIWNADINAGECIYIPAHWWAQQDLPKEDGENEDADGNIIEDENHPKYRILMKMAFENNSHLFKTIMTGINANSILEGKNGKKKFGIGVK